MSSRIANICIDAHDPYSQMRWWSHLLADFTMPDDETQESADDECGLRGPDGRWFLFLRVPEDKTVKNRQHICLRPTDRDRDAEVERVLALGASMVDDRRDGPDFGWAVLADPEGNEFCILRRDATS
ncbi:MAG: VOC family protein [Dermatophilaceae bacterium]|nr:VOC family protein [Actinomycetales bacterium]MBP8882798.1 VOC family protein [Dermatophilaceae bacterium]